MGALRALRRALARIGRRAGFFRVVTGAEKARMIDELVRTAASLASQKRGALIVLERETPLDDYVDSGVTVDALLSRRLLESFFSPSSPLCEGAVIIRRGRVAAASCILPMTRDQGGSVTLGARHRAALGITEETDAVALVISEERGIVSLASSGKLVRDTDVATLRGLLREILAAPPIEGILRERAHA